MRRIDLAAFVLVSAALVAGCGGGDSHSSPTISEVKGSTASRPLDKGRQRSKPYQGGEESIEGFGSEAKGALRAAVLGAFAGYLGSIAADDSDKACVHLSKAVRTSLSQFSANRPGKGAGCAIALSKLLAPAAAAIARQQASGKVTKVRVEGGRAFVVFRAPGAKLYQLTMVREGGTWKAATVAASVLVPQI